MQFSEEWKSLFPISLVHSSPLLLLGNSLLGPLCFNPNPETLTTLLSSRTHFASGLLPPPRVAFPRFIENSTLYDPNGSVPHTTSNAIASSFGSQHFSDCGLFGVLNNRVEPFRCPNDWVIVFFSTGANLDSVGFLVVKVEDSNVVVVDFGGRDKIFTSSVKFDHRIIRLVACRLSDCDVDDSGSLGRVGFLMACTQYGAHWFCVKISGCPGSDCEKPVLDYLGGKLFKSCAVAYAIWNPHLSSECVILLENGALFLFDMESSCFKAKRINVRWNELGESLEDGWFSCEFSWHPRILIVANSKAVFMVDFRFGKCQTSCLLKTEMLGIYTVPENEQLVVFSKAGDDGFFFTVASTQWLLLCDVRKPLMPILRWVHNLQQPCYMTVKPLSELRSHPLIEKHAGASELGYGVILGSFWKSEFSLFCYGRPVSAPTQSFSMKISEFSDSFYAWEKPSELLLSGPVCGCGSCLLNEEFAKDDLPEWIEWQQKKEVALGFFILDKDLSSSLLGLGEHGGFTLVRLMSSGTLQCLIYSASWKLSRTVITANHEIPPHSKDSLMYDMGDDEYRFTKRFRYVKLEYLFDHLNNRLSESLFSKVKDARVIGCADNCSNEFCEFMTEKLKSFGCPPPIVHLSTSDIFSDANMPTSLYEIVTRLMWISLPMSSLEMAFCQYKNVGLELPSIPVLNQAPPFFLKTPSHHVNKRLSKVAPGCDFGGPVVPLHALLALYEISRNGHKFVAQLKDYSPETSIALKSKAVLCLAKEMGITISGNEEDKEPVASLGDENDDAWVDSSNPSPLFLYEHSALVDEFPYLDGEDPGIFLRERKTLISKVAKSKSWEDGKVSKLFDGLSPVELQFNSDDQFFDGEELKSYQFLKKQFSQWQSGFHPCQNIHERLKI